MWLKLVGLHSRRQGTERWHKHQMFVDVLAAEQTLEEQLDHEGLELFHNFAGICQASHIHG